MWSTRCRTGTTRGRLPALHWGPVMFAASPSLDAAAASAKSADGNHSVHCQWTYTAVLKCSKRLHPCRDA